MDKQIILKTQNLTLPTCDSFPLIVSHISMYSFTFKDKYHSIEICFFFFILQDGSVPLHLAAEAGNLAVGRELLNQLKEEQLKVKRVTNGDSTLHVACRKKDFDFIKLCVDCGAVVDAKNVRKVILQTLKVIIMGVIKRTEDFYQQMWHVESKRFV